MTQSSRTVHVIGAGFSGLVSAYSLAKAGFSVEVFEKENRCGGLIRTIETPWGLCETAANGIINSANLEELAADIDVPLIGTRPVSRRRYIFRDRPRRFPLTPHEAVAALSKFSLARPRWPQPFETVEGWGRRVLGSAVTEYLLAPALQGIYAGDVSRLSASLIFSRLFNKKQKKIRSRIRGTVAPKGGMEELIKGLESHLRERGVKFHLGTAYEWLGSDPSQSSLRSSSHTFGGVHARVISTPARAAGEILSPIAPSLARALKSVELLGLVSATVFFPKDAGGLMGFGILFPRDQGFRTLGILCNHFIFEGRSTGQSETWILGGATDPDIFKLRDAEILQLIRKERALLWGPDTPPLGVHVQRWPQALPHYTVELERLWAEQTEETHLLETQNIFLMGNYNGALGLGQILERARTLPGRVR